MLFKSDNKPGATPKLFSPLWPAPLTRKRLVSGKARFEQDREKYCAKCATYWPADTEFFHSQINRTDGLSDWCIACYIEWRSRSKTRKSINKIQ